jgi:hypothetical protein
VTQRTLGVGAARACLTMSVAGRWMIRAWIIVVTLIRFTLRGASSADKRRICVTRHAVVLFYS